MLNFQILIESSKAEKCKEHGQTPSGTRNPPIYNNTDLSILSISLGATQIEGEQSTRYGNTSYFCVSMIFIFICVDK